MRVRVPGDKSLTQRALILATLAEGESCISGLLFGGDASSTAGALRKLGGQPQNRLEQHVRNQVTTPTGAEEVAPAVRVENLAAAVQAKGHRLAVELREGLREGAVPPIDAAFQLDDPADEPDRPVAESAGHVALQDTLQPALDRCQVSEQGIVVETLTLGREADHRGLHRARRLEAVAGELVVVEVVAQAPPCGIGGAR